MANIQYPSPPWHKKQDSGQSETDTQTRVDVFRSTVVPVSQKHLWRRVVASLLVVVLLVAAGFGAYRLFFHSKSSPAYKAPAQTVANAPSATGNKTGSNTSTQTYTATDYNLSFKYPDGWVVFNNGSGPMTVTSPSTQLTSATGQKVTGLITMTIQQQGQFPASFSAGTALAVLNSQRITYTQPTTAQPSQAYLSFVQYASTTTKGGLDGIYLTGNYGYTKDQAIPGSDIGAVNPLVTVTFTKCGNAKCTSNLVPLTIASTSWSKQALQAPIKSMLASLAFQ